jgi:hypothetical protein
MFTINNPEYRILFKPNPLVTRPESNKLFKIKMIYLDKFGLFIKSTKN